jgi:hypothetical protein
MLALFGDGSNQHKAYLSDRRDLQGLFLQQPIVHTSARHRPRQLTCDSNRDELGNWVVLSVRPHYQQEMIT